MEPEQEDNEKKSEPGSKIGVGIAIGWLLVSPLALPSVQPGSSRVTRRMTGNDAESTCALAREAAREWVDALYLKG